MSEPITALNGISQQAQPMNLGMQAKIESIQARIEALSPAERGRVRRAFNKMTATITQRVQARAKEGNTSLTLYFELKDIGMGHLVMKPIEQGSELDTLIDIIHDWYAVVGLQEGGEPMINDARYIRKCKMRMMRSIKVAVKWGWD